MINVALYTTVYPGMEPFFGDWARSVARQTDTGFDLWIGVDGLTVDSISAAAGQTLTADYVVSDPGDTPAMVRNRAIEKMIPFYDAVIFVDSDDILAPTRVEAARNFLEDYDMAGTAMQLIGPTGESLDMTFSLPAGADIADFIYSRNVFGLSNSAYRTATLRDCLPVPADTIAVDWYLATMAFLNGARIGFDRETRMLYRQHDANTARILPPFTPEQVTKATRLVLFHQKSILNSVCHIKDSLRDRLVREHQRVGEFSRTVCDSRESLERYVVALNRLPLQTLWWATVAHPELEEQWKR